MEELRQFSATPVFHTGTAIRAGVTSRLRPLPSWKSAADFLFVQASFSLELLLRWRDSVDFDGPIYAGVMVVASAPMGRKLNADIPEIGVPERWIDAIEREPDAGVRLACELVLQVRDSGAFTGVHLIPVARYREVAARLETELRRRGGQGDGRTARTRASTATPSPASVGTRRSTGSALTIDNPPGHQPHRRGRTGLLDPEARRSRR